MSRAAPHAGTAAGDRSAEVRIGDVAAQLRVSTRTLRYWEEIGLVHPCGPREGGERRYAPADVERAAHVRELQTLLGLSLAEIAAVLDTEDRLERLRAAYRAGDGGRRALLDDATASAQALLARIDERLTHIGGYRERLAGKLERLRAHAADLDRG